MGSVPLAGVQKAPYPHGEMPAYPLKHTIASALPYALLGERKMSQVQADVGTQTLTSVHGW